MVHQVRIVGLQIHAVRSAWSTPASFTTAVRSLIDQRDKRTVSSMPRPRSKSVHATLPKHAVPPVLAGCLAGPPYECVPEVGGVAIP